MSLYAILYVILLLFINSSILPLSDDEIANI